MENDRFRRKWFILAAVSTSAFMGTLDASIVNIALPTISEIFSVDIKTVSLIATSYLLVVTCFLIVAGRLGDIYGRKKVFIMGIGVFTFGSFLCGISQSIVMLVSSRVIQAFGGAMLAGNSAALITDNSPIHERGKVLGLLGTVVAIGLSLGSPLGGIIIENWGWRYIFWVNIPLGILAAMVCIKMLPSSESYSQHSRLDAVGATLLPLILTLLIVAINLFGRDDSTYLAAGIPMALSIILAIYFYKYERQISYPLVDFGILFRTRFLFSNIAGFISYFSTVFVIILIPFYNEQILGLSASSSGKILLTLPLVTMFLAPMAGIISDRIGQRILASAGLAIALMGTAALFGLKESGSSSDVVLRLAIIGVGTGLFTTPNNSAIMGAIPISQRGLASGMLATVRNLGLSIGVASSTSLFAMWNKAMLCKDFTPQVAFLGAFDRVLLISIFALGIGVIFSFLRGKVDENVEEFDQTSK